MAQRAPPNAVPKGGPERRKDGEQPALAQAQATPHSLDVIFVTSHLLDPTQVWVVLTEDLCGIRAKEFIDAISFVPNIAECVQRVAIQDLRLSDGMAPLTKDMLTSQRHKEKTHLSHVWVGTIPILVMGSLYRRKFNESLLHTPFYQSCIQEVNKVSFADVWAAQAQSLELDGNEGGPSGLGRAGDLSGLGTFSQDLALAHANAIGAMNAVGAPTTLGHMGHADPGAMDAAALQTARGFARVPPQPQMPSRVPRPPQPDSNEHLSSAAAASQILQLTRRG